MSKNPADHSFGADAGPAITAEASEPIGSIPPQSWMTAAETRTVIEALSADGDEVRFIGGCVRDAILKREVHDVDLALPAPPKRVVELLEAAGVRAVPTGLEHGTVTAVVNKATFEITSLRVDLETDGRHARVAFTNDWYADAARRDFTFNALSCTPAGDIFDYFGGLEDLGRGWVRFVGDPDARISEDRLRLLRFFRFFAHYGRPPPDPAALTACRRHAGDVAQLSGERVRVETFRTLMAPDPADVFHLMSSYGVLQHVLPEAGAVDRLRMLSWLETKALRVDSIQPDPIRRLAALLMTDSEGAHRVADRLKVSNVERTRLVGLCGPEWSPDPQADGRDLRRALQRIGREAAIDLMLLEWARETANTPRLPHDRTQAWIDAVETADEWTPVTFPLKGRDAIALGLSRGPRVGEVLAQVESWWAEEDFVPDRAQCLRRLQSIVAEHAPQGSTTQEK